MSANAPTEVASSNDAKAPERPKKSFLHSLLTCCSGPDRGTMEAEDPAIPAKRARLTEKSTQSKPGEEAAKKTVPLGEKTHSNGEASRPLPLSEKEALKTEKDGTTEQAAESEASTSEKVTEIEKGADESKVESGDPVAPLEQPATSSKTTDPEASTETQQQHEQQLPTPPAEEAAPISDRTEAQVQRDSDIDMLDAPPAEEELQKTLPPTTEKPVAEVSLPPPPPITKNKELSSPAPIPEAPPVPAVPVEGPRGLLPPVQPHLRGRKCLVLDLDETLVHSSFKVSSFEMTCVLLQC